MEDVKNHCYKGSWAHFFGPKMLYIAITGLTVNLSYVKHLANVSIYTISYNPANDSKR